MSDGKVWSPPKKAGMRLAKTGLAGIIAVVIVEIAKPFIPPLQEPEVEAKVVVVLVAVITSLWTWWKNKVKKEVK